MGIGQRHLLPHKFSMLAQLISSIEALFQTLVTWSSSMKVIRVGLVGCGRASNLHLNAYSRTRGVKLVAVCDIDSARAQEARRRHGVELAVSDYDSLLKLDLDLVDLTTPTPTHAPLATLAFEAGHNVLVEKPMAVTSKEAESMIRTARKSGRALCVVHNRLFFDSIIRTRATLSNEGVGVSRMRVTDLATHVGPAVRERWIMSEESGGILWERLVHQVYVVEHFLGQARSVYAAADSLKQPVYDAFTLVLRKEKRMAVCEHNWNAKETVSEARIVTETGDIFLADLVHDFAVRKSGGDKNRGTVGLRSMYYDLYTPSKKWLGYLRSFLEIRSYPGALPYNRAFLMLIRKLVSFLNDTSSNPPVTAEEGLRAVKVLEAARKSIETHREEPIE